MTHNECERFLYSMQTAILYYIMIYGTYGDSWQFRENTPKKLWNSIEIYTYIGIQAYAWLYICVYIIYGTVCCTFLFPHKHVSRISDSFFVNRFFFFFVRKNKLKKYSVSSLRSKKKKKKNFNEIWLFRKNCIPNIIRDGRTLPDENRNKTI